MRMVEKEALPVHTLCIDNKKVRDHVRSSKKVVVDNVPCILAVYEDGYIEKYEGERAMQFTKGLVEKYRPSEPSPSEPSPSKPSPSEPPPSEAKTAIDEPIVSSKPKSASDIAEEMRMERDRPLNIPRDP
jgi:hypothetical protein